MMVLFDSRSLLFKRPFGCAKEGETLTLNIYVKDAEEDGAFFLIEKDGGNIADIPMYFLKEQEGYRVYSLQHRMTETGLYFYHFALTACGERVSVFRDGYNSACFEGGGKWQLTCYRECEPVSKELYGRVMYQIFPDRFYRVGQCDLQEKLTPFIFHENVEELPFYEPNHEGQILNNDFFGGNLSGIRARLDYLYELGVRVLYLNPIFMAFSNHRYDTADYMRIDPMLGTCEDFNRLCEEAHNLGMRVVLDGVFSHTGSDSLYFDKKNRFGNGAYHNANSPYRAWYQFREYPHVYTSWWGIDTLPCIIEENPDYLQFITGEEGVARYWLRQGADGWRLDVADELPDGFLQALYAAVKAEKPEALVIGEVWEDASNKISYGKRRHYLQGGYLDSVMNYVWRDGIIRFVKREITEKDFCEIVMCLCEHYPESALHNMMNTLSTHDTPRILTALHQGRMPQSKQEQAEFYLNEKELKATMEKLQAAVFLQFTLPGCPSIYYGDEIGMEGFFDPFNRQYMGEKVGNREIKEWYRRLAAIKNKRSALQKGRTEVALCEEGVFGFWRLCEKERVLAIVNVSGSPKEVLFKGEVLYEHNVLYDEERKVLLPYGALIFLM